MIRDSYTTSVRGKYTQVKSHSYVSSKDKASRYKYKHKYPFEFTHFLGMNCYKSYILNNISVSDDVVDELQQSNDKNVYSVLHLENGYTISVGRSVSNYKARVFCNGTMVYESISGMSGRQKVWKRYSYGEMVVHLRKLVIMSCSGEL